MKMIGLLKKIAQVCLILGVTGMAGNLRADTNLVNVTFLGGYIAYGSYYVGPYNFILNNTVKGQQNTALVCMNFTNEIYGGETWQATVSTFDNISLTRNPTQLSDYEEVGWLYNYGVANPSQWGPVNYAIWSIFAPNQTRADGGWSQSAANLLTQAQNQTFTSGEFANLAILTPTTSGPQEFIGTISGYTQQNPGAPAATPEPGTLALAGIGALIFGKKLIRRTANA